MNMVFFSPLSGDHIIQDNVVLDGHHRLRACKELGIPVSYNTKDFTDKPLEELKFVVSANLHRRHLDEFQRAVVAIRFDKLFRKIARDRYMATQFTSETARQAANKRHKKESEDFLVVYGWPPGRPTALLR